MSRATTIIMPMPYHALTGIDGLLAMLTFRRPAFAKSERSFIERFIRPYGMQTDTFGNLYKRIGTAPVLYSCHTDTVHTQGGRQTLQVSNGIVRTDDSQSNCLGADDTAGCWLMLEMIRANRPGLYVFHRAEEIGGQGSSFIANTTPALLTGILYAIAFDRRGNGSIITHQGSRCCSDAFGLSLTHAIGLDHELDQGGLFTDTANYTDLIGECTNVSVGYQREHTKHETLDLTYIEIMRDALLRLDVSDLVAERQPGEVDKEDFDYSWPDEDQAPIGISGRGRSIASLLRDHPDEVADWLEDYGINADEIASAIHLRGGVIR